MALPTNDHHVHSDGYTSERGEPDIDRMLDEMADEIELEPGVEEIRHTSDISGPYIEVVTADASVDLIAIEETASSWGCKVQSVGDDVLNVRPE